eukprot:353262-Chlamydomonas_euryale.AAC.4
MFQGIDLSGVPHIEHLSTLSASLHPVNISPPFVHLSTLLAPLTPVSIRQPFENVPMFESTWSIVQLTKVGERDHIANIREIMSHVTAPVGLHLCDVAAGCESVEHTVTKHGPHFPAIVRVPKTITNAS